MNDRWVTDQSLDPNDCHLEDCREEKRLITGLRVAVSFQNVEVLMHPKCARAFIDSIRLEKLQARCQHHARWN